MLNSVAAGVCDFRSGDRFGGLDTSFLLLHLPTLWSPKLPAVITGGGSKTQIHTGGNKAESLNTRCGNLVSGVLQMFNAGRSDVSGYLTTCSSLHCQ